MPNTCMQYTAHSIIFFVNNNWIFFHYMHIYTLYILCMPAFSNNNKNNKIRRREREDRKEVVIGPSLWSLPTSYFAETKIFYIAGIIVVFS